MTDKTSVKTSPFEHNHCGRCAGTGYTGFHWVHNGVCFACGGSGLRYTKRGAVARDMFLRSLEVPAHEIVVGGRKVRFEGVSAGSFSAAGGWVNVESVEIDERGLRKIDGKTDDGRSFGWGGVGFDTPMRVAWTTDEKKAKLDAALAFQATLTKSGTPRKVKGGKAA